MIVFYSIVQTLITVARKYDHVTPLLMERQWPVVEHRVSFKLGITVFKIVYNMAPSYVWEGLYAYSFTIAILVTSSSV